MRLVFTKDYKKINIALKKKTDSVLFNKLIESYVYIDNDEVSQEDTIRRSTYVYKYINENILLAYADIIINFFLS